MARITTKLVSGRALDQGSRKKTRSTTWFEFECKFNAIFGTERGKICVRDSLSDRLEA